MRPRCWSLPVCCSASGGAGARPCVTLCQCHNSLYTCAGREGKSLRPALRMSCRRGYGSCRQCVFLSASGEGSVGDAGRFIRALCRCCVPRGASFWCAFSPARPAWPMACQRQDRDVRARHAGGNGFCVRPARAGAYGHLRHRTGHGLLLQGSNFRVFCYDCRLICRLRAKSVNCLTVVIHEF